MFPGVGGGGIGGGGLFSGQTPGNLGLGGGGGVGTGIGGNTGMFSGGMSSTGAGLFTSQQSGMLGATGGLGGSGLGGGAGMFGQPQQNQQGSGLFGFGGGLGGGVGASSSGLAGGGLFQSPISSSAGLGLGGGGLTGNRLGYGGGAGMGVASTGAFSTPLFNRGAVGTSQAGLGLGTGGLGLGGGTSLGGLGGGVGLGAMGMGGGGVIGTPLAYGPIKGNDVMIKSGVSFNIYTLLHCITGMKQYENKSLEELRFEDYSCNRKGSAGTGGIFTSQAGGLMGGASGTGLFSGGAGGASGLFNTGQQGTGLFGGGVNKTGLFPTSKPGGLGGGIAGGGLLNPTSQQSGLFSGMGGLSGGSGLGGMGASGTLFGGQTSLGGTSGGLFTGGLGGMSAAGLGAQGQLGGGLKTSMGMGGIGGLGTGLGAGGLGGGIGTQAGALGGGIFNKPLGGGGLGTGIGGGLGTQTGQLGTGLGMGTGLGTGTGLGIGQPGGLGTGLGLSGTGMGLGGGTTGTLGLSGGLGGQGLGMGYTNPMTQNPLQNLTTQQQQAQIQQQLQILASSPFGDSPLFRTALNESDKTKKARDNTPVSSKISSSTSSASPHYKLNIRPSAKFHPVSLNSPSQKKDKNAIFDGLNDSISGNESFVPRSSIKKLIIKPKPKETPPVPVSMAPPTSESPLSNGVPTPLSTSTTVSLTKPAFPVTPVSAGKTNESVESPELVLGVPGSKPIHKPTPVRPTPPADNTMNELGGGGGGGEQTVSSTTPTYTITDSPLPTPSSQPLQATTAVILTKPEYYTRPPLDELEQLVDQDGNCIIEDFTVGKTGCGEIIFIGKTDVTGMNLDELVSINPKEVTVYPDDSLKPQVGVGLNKRAQVQLSGYWPICKTTRQPIKDPERLAQMDYVTKLKRSSSKIGATFQDYIPDTGTCIFEVEHFSKYKLVADDDESDDDDQGTSSAKAKTKGGSTTTGTGQPVVLTSQTGLTTTTHTSVLTSQTGLITTQPALLTSQTSLTTSQLPVHPLTQDQDEDFSDNEGEEFQDAEDHVTMSRPLAPSHHLATTLGLDTHRIQVMKASFFTDFDSISQDHLRYVPPIRTALLQPGTIAHTQPLAPPIQRDHMTTKLFPRPPVETFPTLGSVPTSPHLSASSLSRQPEQVVHSGPYHIVPSSQVIPQQKVDYIVSLEESIICNKTGLLADAGVTFGRSFRVGWGPNWSLSHTGFQLAAPLLQISPPQTVYTALTSSHDDKEAGLKFRITMEKLDASPWMKDELLPLGDIKELYEPILKIQLSHSEVQLKDEEEFMEDGEVEDVPMIVPVRGQALLKDIVECCHKLTNEYEPQLRSQFCEVFDLVNALWGQLSSEDDNDNKENGRSSDKPYYWNLTERRRRLSKWLTGVTRDKSDAKKEQGYLFNLFDLLTQFRLPEACSLAHSNQDHKLALLISQAASSNVMNRQMLRQQLNEWDRLEAHEFIHPQRLLIYVLLAGLMVWEGQGQYINACEGLPWRKALALHLWYGSSPTASISEVMRDYNDAFKGEDSYAAVPFPPYILSEKSLDVEQPDNRPYDTCFHLLQLYCMRDYNLDLTFAPSGSTPYQLDYRISWHLWSVLSCFGYNHTHPSQLASLHCHFAAQLESMGAWPWAVFVAQHLEVSMHRYNMVHEILCRHCSSEDLTENEVFIIEELHVPYQLVFEAKAQRAEYDGRHDLQATHLLQGSHWNKAHAVIMCHVAPVAIVTDDTAGLLKQLELLADHCTTIQNWDTQGSVYLDYLRVAQRIEELANADHVSMRQLDDVYTGLQGISTRIGLLSSHTPLECLCQTEIAKRTATFLRAVMNIKSELGPTSTREDRLLLPTISTLPMPEEYTLFELRQLSSSLPLPTN